MAQTDDALPPRDEPTEVDAANAGASLRRGLISLALLVVLVAALLLAVPGFHGVAKVVTHMRSGWIAVAAGLEVLSCLGYVVAFLQVFERAPLRFGARVALSELAFGSAVSLGGVGSIAVGAWMLVDRGGEPKLVAQRSAVLFLLTSAINVITLFLAGLGLWIGLLPGPRNPLLSVLPAGVAAGAFILFLLLPSFTERLAQNRSDGRLRAVLIQLATSIRLTERILFSADWRIVGAVAFLWCDIGVLAACFAAAGHVPPLAVIVLAYQIGYLSNVIPIPGGIGVLDGSLVGMLVLYRAPAAISTAAVLVYHAIALWIPAMWGTAAFIILRRTRNQPLTPRAPRDVRRGPRRVRRSQDS